MGYNVRSDDFPGANVSTMQTSQTLLTFEDALVMLRKDPFCGRNGCQKAYNKSV